MSKPLKQNNKKLIFAALFTAVICILSQIAIPTPAIPITLQTFAVCLCGYLLGTKLALLSVLCYIILGAVGLPVFYGFQGGAQHLISLTGGFIFGFIPLAFFCGISSRAKKHFLKISLGIIGVLLCHIMGVIQFWLVSNNNLIASFIIASLPYILKDIPLCIAALYISAFVRKKGILL